MNKKHKRHILAFTGIICLSLISILIIRVCKEPFLIELGTNNIRFTDKYDSSATLLIPAAYTNEDGTIEGEYRIAGKTYGTPTRKERISLHPTKGLIISGRWQADYGFQQTVLIKNGKIRYHEDTRKAVRRALAMVNGQLAIIQSCYPQTLNQFSESIHKYCDNAVNLDMGDYGYGWYKNKQFFRIFKYKQKCQTNWIYIE